jgi:methionyl-tRNA formyltransferase
MFIQILVDNPNSWILPFLNQLREQIEDLGHDTSLIYSHDEVKNGDILCLLSCIKIFKNLNLNKHNLVVHESNLPKGKGWSPLTWQILDGAGQIYSQLDIDLDGTELIDEIREKQAILTNKLIIDFVKLYPNNVGINQIGIETFYKKRKPEDSVLDIERSLSEQFNLLRVCDNERYPAYFEIKGIKYYLKIYKNVERY